MKPRFKSIYSFFRITSSSSRPDLSTFLSKKLFLVGLVLLLVIGQASAVVSVVASDEIQCQDTDTTNNTSSNGTWFITSSTCTISQNVTGTLRFKGDLSSGNFPWSYGAIKVSESAGTDTDAQSVIELGYGGTGTVDVSGTWSSGTIFTLYGRHGGGSPGTWTAGNLRLMYDEILPPTNIVATSGSNWINWTWTPVNYSASYEITQDGINRGLITSAYWNKSFLRGLHNITIRTYESTTDGYSNSSNVVSNAPGYIRIFGDLANSESNFSLWNMNGIVLVGGTTGTVLAGAFGDNWNNNHTTGYTRKSPGTTNDITTGTISYNSNFIWTMNANLNNLWYSTGLNLTNTDTIVYFNAYSQNNPASHTIYIASHINAYSGSNANDADLDYLEYNIGTGNLVINSRKTGTWYTDKATTVSLPQFKQTNTTMVMRFRVNGTKGYGKIWNASDTEPDAWDINTNLGNLNNSFGSVGFGGTRSVLTVDNFYVRNTSSLGVPVTNGSISTGYKYELDGFHPVSVKHHGWVANGATIGYSIISNNDNVTNHIDTFDNQSLWLQWRDISNNISKNWNITILINGADKMFGSMIGLQVKIDGSGNSTYPLLSGHITNSTGAAVPNARVVYNLGTTTTNSTGYYSFDNIDISSAFGSNITFVAGGDGYIALAKRIESFNTSGTTLDFVLNTSTIYIPNAFLEEANLMVQRYMGFMNESGHIVDIDPMDQDFASGSGQYEGQISASGAMIFVKGLNQTPELLEKILRQQNHNIQLWSNGYDSDLREQPKQHNGDHSVYYVSEGMLIVRPYIDSTQWLYFSNGAATMDYSDIFSVAFLNNATTVYNNWYMYGSVSVCNLNLIQDGNCNNNYLINKSVNMFVNQINGKGVQTEMEAGQLSINYNLVNTYTGYNLIKKGFSNQSFFDALNISRMFTENSTLQNGYQIPIGRGHNQMSSYTQLFMYPVLLTNMGLGNPETNYRFLDKAWHRVGTLKYNTSEPYWNRTYYPVFNFYDPLTNDRSGVYGGAGVGSCAYCDWQTQQTFTMYWLAYAGLYWDNSVIEKEEVFYNFNDLNLSLPDISKQSGLVINNFNNYSVSVYPIPSSYTVFDYKLQNGSETYPRHFYIARKDSMNFSISPVVDTDINTSRQRWQNDITFNNRAKYVNHTNSSVLIKDFTNLSYGQTDTVLWMNWTNITLVDGTMIDYINMSATYNTSSDSIDFQNTYGWNNAMNPINHIEYGLWFIQNDGRTLASMILNNTAKSIFWQRGMESVNVTNITATNGDINIVQAPSDFGGYSTFGYYNLTYITGNVTASPYTVSYNYKEDTTNVFGFTLNQDPFVWDEGTSPESPYDIESDETSIFTVMYSQNMDNITWTINGSVVETDYDSDIASYTNTSPIVGNYTVNATGSNAQGNATMSWTWNVTLENNPPASVTFSGMSCTNTNFTCNATYTEPTNTDFDHVYWLNETGDLNENTSKNSNYHEFKGLPVHSNVNRSAQTVDTNGNMNTTKVWFNATIPNNAPVQSAIGNKNVTAGSWLNFSVNATDADSDTITYGTNASNGTLNTTTGNFNWSTTGADVGTYYWNFNSSDGYGGVDDETITITVIANISVYNTGWQPLMVNDTTTTQTFGDRYSVTWLSSWNATSQKYESYKSGWSQRTSQSLTKGSGVLAKVATNATIGMAMNSSYTFNLSTGWNLVGIELTKTLSQINSSVNTACEVDQISYTNLSTQIEYLFTCGNAGNGTVQVLAGTAVWMNATTAVSKARSW